MKKILLTIFVSLLLTVNAYAKELKLNEIINYFNFCKIPSSFGPSCSDDFNPRDYLNSLKITIKENEIHYGICIKIVNIFRNLLYLYIKPFI